MGQGAMQGLQAAQPAVPEAQGQAPQVEDGMAILQAAVEQYGPEIIEVLRQILAQAGSAPEMGAPAGMM